jgi:hypothetical protein
LSRRHSHERDLGRRLGHPAGRVLPHAAPAQLGQHALPEHRLLQGDHYGRPVADPDFDLVRATVTAADTTAWTRGPTR